MIVGALLIATTAATTAQAKTVTLRWQHPDVAGDEVLGFRLYQRPLDGGWGAALIELLLSDLTPSPEGIYQHDVEIDSTANVVFSATAFSSEAESYKSNQREILADPVPAVCGDGLCVAGEDWNSCIQDCPVCETSSAEFKNASFDAQSGNFSIDYDAIPGANNLDSLVMLSDGPRSTWDDYAVLVRFASNGTIDVRNGDGYAADLSLPYSAGKMYRFIVDVDVRAHTYSVYVTPEGGTRLTLATNYRFRTSQQDVTQLGNWAVQSDAGSHDTCSFVLVGGTPAAPVAPALLQP
jgi:hypothetical protein